MREFRQTKAAGLVLFAVLLLVFQGCSPYAAIRNVRKGTAINNQPLLAGKLECFSNGEQARCDRGYRLFIKDMQTNVESALITDRQGFIYVALPPGKYQFSKFLRSGGWGKFFFPLEPPPSFEIKPEGHVTNFGVIRFDYSQSNTSKATRVLTGVSWGGLNVLYVQNFDEVEQKVHDIFNTDLSYVRQNFNITNINDGAIETSIGGGLIHQPH